MGFAGLIVTLLGFIIAVAGLGLTSSAGGRMGFAIIGLLVSLFGIVGLINPAYQKNAIWKR